MGIGRNNRKFIAGLMLLLFMMGMTPRMFLHDIFTSHEHADGNRSHTQEILPKGFQCDVKSLVANAPFIEEEKFGLPLVDIKYFHSYSEDFINFYYSGVFSDYSLRGPPVFHNSI